MNDEVPFVEVMEFLAKKVQLSCSERFFWEKKCSRVARSTFFEKKSATESLGALFLAKKTQPSRSEHFFCQKKRSQVARSVFFEKYGASEFFSVFSPAKTTLIMAIALGIWVFCSFDMVAEFLLFFYAFH
jgi:hypothetical protein